jgi:hypothetical protein
LNRLPQDAWTVSFQHERGFHYVINTLQFSLALSWRSQYLLSIKRLFGLSYGPSRTVRLALRSGGGGYYMGPGVGYYGGGLSLVLTIDNSYLSDFWARA